MNSVLEAASASVPLICVPFFGDQHYNSEAMAARGWAHVLDIHEKNGNKLKRKLVNALTEMLAKGYLKLKLYLIHIFKKIKIILCFIKNII